MLTAFAVLLCLTALLAWVNDRFFDIPTTVGVTLSGALAAIAMVLVDRLGWAPGVRGQAAELLETLNFTDFVLNGVLSVLLFAGALGLDARLLLRQRVSIGTLAVASTVVSTALIGLAAWGVFALVGLPLPLLWALLFGALISPTDPVAVLDLLKRARVPKKIETLIAGESLFNDGIGVVLFLVVAALLGIGDAGGAGTFEQVGDAHVDVTLGGAALLFAREAVGGLAFGAAIGWLCSILTASARSHAVDILITLATVVGGYVAASSLGVSGPLAMVVAGLVVSARRGEGEGEEEGALERQLVDGFWETLDQVLNILLFAFLGLDVLLTEVSPPQVVAGVALVPLVLAARFASVAVPFPLVRRRDAYGAWTVRLLTWGGLRGGIAISLALGLPPSPYRAQLLTATYAIVLFSIAVQGLTVMPLVRRAAAAEEALSARHV